MRISSITRKTLLLALIAILSLSACTKTSLEETALPPSQDVINPTEEIAATEYSEGEIEEMDIEAEDIEDVATGFIYPVLSTEENVPPTSLDPLPSTPQSMTFLSLDNQELRGTFYPAAQVPAPLIVLMHWAKGNQEDFKAIAPWLQNRGVVYQPAPGETDWLDPSWYPVMPSGLSFNVFTFTFRGCENGCSSFDQETREAWKLDAKAAVEFASNQYGVDPTQIQTIGASIGADGAATGCYNFNLYHTSGCLGALSLSPGSEYPLEVDNLAENNPLPQAWCLYGEEDGDYANACRAAAGPHYTAFAFPETAHGMELLTKEMSPSAIQVLFTFITQ